MSEPARKIATYQDLHSLPESMIGEIIHGELVATPRPSFAHSHVAFNISGELARPFGRGSGGGPGGWLILYEPEIYPGGQVLVPDFAGWRREKLAGQPRSEWATIPPDWVCEILSPSTALRDRSVKKAIYEDHRVGHLWLVDPLHMTIEVFRLESGRWVEADVFGGDEKARIEPFQEIEITLGELWLKD